MQIHMLLRVTAAAVTVLCLAGVPLVYGQEFAVPLTQVFTDTLSTQQIARAPTSGVDLLQVALSLGPCAIRYTHYHANADELILVTSGVLGYGNILPNNTIVTAEVPAGQIIAQPKAGLHFVYNPTCERTNITNVFTAAFPVTYTVDYALNPTSVNETVWDFIKGGTYIYKPVLRSRTRGLFTYNLDCLLKCKVQYNTTAVFGW